MTEVKYDIGGGKEIIAEYDENGIMEITRECFEMLIEKQIPKKSYDAADWATAEAAGLICLPPAGYRDGTEVKSGEGNGFYWASTTDAADKASNLGFKKSDN